MPYTCKQLSNTETSILKTLLRVFGEAFEDIETYQGAVPGDRYLQALLERPHFIAVVAFDGEEVAGGLAAYELEKFEQERREIYIYDLAVAKDHRRRGVATALIEELRRIGEARGAYVIFVQADRGDTPAIRLYESLGVKEAVFHFDIAVASKQASRDLTG